MNRFLNFVMLVLVLLFLILLVSTASHAATVKVQPLYDGFVNVFLQTLLEGLALALSGWVMYLFHKYLAPLLGAQLEAKARASLNTALANGVAIAMHKIEGAETAYSSVEVKSQIAAWAAQYAVDHAPGSVAKFGLGPNDLALKALAYVPPAPTTQDTTSSTISKPVLVSSQPLPDITGQQ